MKLYFEDYERALMSDHPFERLKQLAEKEMSLGESKSSILSFHEKLLIASKERNWQQNEVHSIKEMIRWLSRDTASDAD